VNRAKLYYLRGRVGKKARVREKRYGLREEETTLRAVSAPDEAAEQEPAAEVEEAEPELEEPVAEVEETEPEAEVAEAPADEPVPAE